MSDYIISESSDPKVPSINGKYLFNSIARNPYLFASTVAATVFFSGVYAFTSNRVWQGQFEIVLDNSSNNNSDRLSMLAASNPMLSDIAGLGSKNSNLDTEVKILGSPSVLKPIYDFVVEQKNSDESLNSHQTYVEWLEDISIDLVKGTSVLSFAYRDTNKELILPILDKITASYQNYSGEKREQNLKSGIIYLTDEIAKLKDQSKDSMSKAHEFAIDNDLVIQDGMPNIGVSSNTSSSIEARREAVQNKVNALQQQITFANDAGFDRIYQAPQLKATDNLYSNLQKIESELYRLSALLTPEDESIKALKRQRNSLIMYLNQQTINLLKGELLTLRAELQSLQRPRKVLIEHRQLIRDAIRDEKILSDLEIQLQSLKLELARQSKPWELISKPTLLDSPVAPNRKNILFLGLLCGMIFGSLLSGIKDKLSGLIFEFNELDRLIPYSFLGFIDFSQKRECDLSVDSMMNGPLSNASSLTFLHLEEEDDKLILPITELFSKYCSKISVENGRSSNKNNDSLIVLVIKSKHVSRKLLNSTLFRLELQNTSIAGWILIADTSQ